MGAISKEPVRAPTQWLKCWISSITRKTSVHETSIIRTNSPRYTSPKFLKVTKQTSRELQDTHALPSRCGYTCPCPSMGLDNPETHSGQPPYGREYSICTHLLYQSACVGRPLSMKEKIWPNWPALSSPWWRSCFVQTVADSEICSDIQPSSAAPVAQCFRVAVHVWALPFLQSARLPKAIPLFFLFCLSREPAIMLEEFVTAIHRSCCFTRLTSIV